MLAFDECVSLKKRQPGRLAPARLEWVDVHPEALLGGGRRRKQTLPRSSGTIPSHFKILAEITKCYGIISTVPHFFCVTIPCAGWIGSPEGCFSRAGRSRRENQGHVNHLRLSHGFDCVYISERDVLANLVSKVQYHISFGVKISSVFLAAILSQDTVLLIPRLLCYWGEFTPLFKIALY